MGQATRQTKYDKFWAWVAPTSGGYEDAIQILLLRLTDEELDDLLRDTVDATSSEDEDD